MKTYTFFYMFLAYLVIIGCNKSDNGPGLDEISANADYTLLLSSDGMLAAQPLNAAIDVLTVDSAESPFAEMVLPQLTFKEGSVLSLYHKLTDCSGKITKYDFGDHTSKNFEVFTDLGSCNLIAMAIAHSETMVYIAYTIEANFKDTKYFVRIFDTKISKPTFEDVALDKKPIQLVVADNKLFILTFDEGVTDENGLTVMDLDTKELIHEMNLGYNAKRIIKNIDGNLIIGYDELHTLLNSSTMDVQYVSYEAGKEPKFTDSKIDHLDGAGKLYYQRPNEGEIPHIPAVYDFPLNMTYLYIYENFLTEVQIGSEFEIGDTTMVGYDKVNNLILIGYKKYSDANKGGLLRVKPVPKPAFIDNIDLDGVPYDVFVNRIR